MVIWSFATKCFDSFLFSLLHHQLNHNRINLSFDFCFAFCRQNVRRLFRRQKALQRCDDDDIVWTCNTRWMDCETQVSGYGCDFVGRTLKYDLKIKFLVEINSAVVILLMSDVAIIRTLEHRSMIRCTWTLYFWTAKYFERQNCRWNRHTNWSPTEIASTVISNRIDSTRYDDMGSNDFRFPSFFHHIRCSCIDDAQSIDRMISPSNKGNAKFHRSHCRWELDQKMCNFYCATFLFAPLSLAFCRRASIVDLIMIIFSSRCRENYVCFLFIARCSSSRCKQ